MPIGCQIEAVIDVIMDQPAPRLADRFLDRIKLLRQIKAAAPFLKHGDDPAHMAVRPLEAFDDIRMRRVNMGAGLRHGGCISYPGGYVNCRPRDATLLHRQADVSLTV